jgi:hypothetical protein
VKTLLLGVLLGAIVVFDPVATTYLMRDFSWLRDLPYLISIAAAFVVCIAFGVRRFVPVIVAKVIYDYWRYFPFVFLVCFQFTGVTFGTFDPTELAIGIFLLLFVAGLFIDRDQRFVTTPFNVLHLALAVCIALSLISEFRLTVFLKSFKYFVVFFLLINFLPRGNLIPAFMRWLVVLAMLSAAFGLIQEVMWLGAHIVISPVPQKELELQFEAHFGLNWYRVGAMMVNYQDCAEYLATAMLLSISALLWRKETTLLRRRWLIIGLCLMFPAIFLTLSKPVYLGCALGIPLLLVMRWPVRAVPLALAGVLVGTLGLVAVTAIVPGRIDTMIDLTRTVPKSEIERIRLDRDALQGWASGPYFWTGRGIGQSYRYTAHSRRWPPHNAFIMAAAEIGVFGLVVYLMFWGLFIARVVALNIVVTRGPYLFVVRALAAILLVFLSQMSFEGHFFDNLIWPIAALAEALWFLARRQAVATTEPLASKATA